MGIALAIKRSYRHFLPAALFQPRMMVRRWYPLLSLYVIGLLTGMSWRPVSGQQLEIAFIATIVALIVLKWWSGGTATQPEA